MTCPPIIQDYATQAVEYVERAVGVKLAFDSETLPILDHYARQVPDNKQWAEDLISALCGAYFGEVVRAVLGGSWQLADPDDAATWQFILPGGLSFYPTGFAAAAIACSEVEGYNTGFDVPPRVKSVLEDGLARMGPVTEEVYYSFSGRFDTVEHLQDIIVQWAAQELGE